VFGAGVRPVPLEIVIQAFDIASLEARMQAMARPAYTAVSAQAREGKPTILFVPTRRQARLTALDLLTYAAADGQPKKFLQVRPLALHSLICTLQTVEILLFS
jgi:pre-mRNA-splicing helicase BRR2